MDKPLPSCNQPAANDIYKHLIDLAKRGFLPGLNLDGGFRVLNYKYKEQSKSKEGIAGNNDHTPQCEEIWENGLSALDSLGKAADWEEDLTLAKDEDHKQAIKRYQKFRELVECKTGRAIPWVFEAPYMCEANKQKEQQDKTKLEQAKAIRAKVRNAIGELKKLLLAKEDLDPTQRQRCLVACLYWFVLVPEDGKGEPLDDQKNPQFAPFLIRQGINETTANKIRDEFSEYLQSSGGGLGLFLIKPDDDAQLEGTALETVLKRKGWCTEQSKVMYAVLRMAGIKASFVEPRLSVEYRIAKAKPEEKEKLKELTDKPLQSHMASGVAVEILDKNGKKSFWVIDVTSRLLEADYIQEETGQWEAHPYWELSLRHFYMADLANLGFDQTVQGNFLGAEQSFKMALDLGEDSTAFHAMGNYAHLLSKKAELLSCRLKDKRKICEDIYNGIDNYSKGAVAINPGNPAFQFSRGKYLFFKHAWDASIEAFLQSMDADPRFVLAYQELGRAIYNIHQDAPNLFLTVWGELKKEINVTVTKHPKLREVIKKGLEEEIKRKIPSVKPSGKEVIDLIDKLKKD